MLQRMCRFVVEAESGDVEPLPEYEKSGRQVIHGNEFCRVAWKATNLPEEDGDVEILYLFWGIIRGSKVMFPPPISPFFVRACVCSPFLEAEFACSSPGVPHRL